MHTLYAYSGNDVAEMSRSYANVVRREFYDGDLSIDPSDHLDISVQKAIAHPMTLLQMSGRCGVSFRRSWQHIRANKADVRVIWFVRSGSLKIVRSRATCTVEAGQCVFLNSSVPFYAQTTVGPDGSFDAVQGIVPAHLFLSHLPAAFGFDTAFELNTTAREAVRKILDLLFDEGDHLSGNAVQPLVAAFLETIADSVNEIATGSVRRLSVVDKRLADIEAYIIRNLTNPDLSYNSVAKKCGISPRYLCYVLKAHNTSFSDLLWANRLLKAREWLVSEALREYQIHEIASMAGFKSAAHFSRMFKATYNCSPKDYRAHYGTGAHKVEAAVTDVTVPHEII